MAPRLSAYPAQQRTGRPPPRPGLTQGQGLARPVLPAPTSAPPPQKGQTTDSYRYRSNSQPSAAPLDLTLTRKDASANRNGNTPTKNAAPQRLEDPARASTLFGRAPYSALDHDVRVTELNTYRE